MDDAPRLGARVRALRRQQGLSQVRLAERLGISASYLNLIEHGRRPMPAELLLRIAQEFQLELKSFVADDEARILADLLEVFSDPMFDAYAVTPGDVRGVAAQVPAVARALVGLYHAWQQARDSARDLAERVSEGADLAAVEAHRLPSEEVSELLQRHGNHFPELEAGAEQIGRDARLPGPDLYQQLVSYLAEAHGVQVRVEKVGAMRGAVRRYDPGARVLLLSEVLRRGSRNFQLAYQVGLLTQAEALNRLADDPGLTTPSSRALARVALANYVASAVLMPYEAFLRSAREVRYDIELLGHRFRTSFEQVCHRLTTLRRPGSEGVPFHFVRVDAAGNISKRFSASGVRIARFSGACPRWILHGAFQTPGRFRVQVSRMPDGTSYFCVARTVGKEAGGYHAQHAVHAIEIGCPLGHARDLVYSDGVDLENLTAAVPVGVTCRLCERRDCEERVLPAVQTPLRVDENVRGVSFYAPVAD
jgi:predicted transcriptional regulator/transcriptional regulator with XRE-family HTH domain